MLAGGPTRWLTYECDDSLSCAHVVIDQASGARRSLGTPVPSTEPNSGSISPDGRTAALLLPSDGTSSSGIRLLDLDSGAVTSVEVTMNVTQVPQGPRWVWSPDSRWLFVVDTAGQVTIVNRGTGRGTPLGTRLPPVTQLALRHSTG